MSSIGTGVAAGVAQTGLTAQQVARGRDRRNAQRSRESTRLAEFADGRLAVLDENDRDAPDRLSINAELPHRQQAGEGPVEPPADGAADAVTPEPDEQPTVNQRPKLGPDGLYRHVDVQA